MLMDLKDLSFSASTPKDIFISRNIIFYEHILPYHNPSPIAPHNWEYFTDFPTSFLHLSTKFHMQSLIQTPATLIKPYLPSLKTHHLFLMIHQMTIPLNTLPQEFHLEPSIHHHIIKIMFVHLFMMHRFDQNRYILTHITSIESKIIIIFNNYNTTNKNTESHNLIR